ncbi:nucleotide-diphospho-sugar transferase [Mucilaginibacter sp.]|uniref:nucleotide-diphospho-sugar transferase n=1 Tax=Mucilaginibacter sp. TaxID=1882438 RepID=UPI0025DE052A|nr:nucleotide-diphospho-sugar transferase [Mucilaginibacter sp.]
METAIANSSTKSAVLFIIFNRPDTTKRVFSQIRKAKPPRLYIAADGPRVTKPNEAELCKQARAIVSEIDWDCQVQTLFKDVNAGCKNGVSSALDWFFSHEDEGIILEDDCLPADTFFKYCDELLEKYRFDTRIRHIGGSNLQGGKIWGDASYYYSNMTHVWGWAGWRRVWKEYDKNLSRYDENDVRSVLSNIFDEPLIVDAWEEIFKEMKGGLIDTWDYQLTFTNFFNNSLSIIPNHNLISNIGFGVNATHTTHADSAESNIPVVEIGQITHPVYMVPQKQADYITLSREFNVVGRKKDKTLRRRFKRWIKSPFKK